MRLYRILGVCTASLLLMAPAAMAQKWEFGGGVGGNFYLSRDVANGSTSASAGVRTNVASSVWLGNNASGKWGGEVRYDYERGDYSLERGSTSTTFGGETHALHYDILWHATRRGSKVRPFLGAGAGIKVYRGTGQEVGSQPLAQYALLTKGNELKALLSLGAGVKWEIMPKLQFRLEVHDYITPFPQEIITPNVGSHVSGIFQNIVPMVAIAYTF
jgi:Outer membrane protein beta-barrel domain